MWDGGDLGRRTSLQGGPGKSLAHLDVPRRVLEAPWTWVSREVPRTSPVLPGLSGRPRSSPEFPWGFLGFRTSQRLLPASPGRPDVPGASPGLPGTSGLSREVTRGSLKSLTLARSPTDRHDRSYPSGQRSSGRASTPKACFGICSLGRNSCSRAPPPSVVHNGWFGVRETCVLVLFCSPQSRFGSSSTSRTLTDRILPASWRTGQMMRVKCQGA